MRRGLVTLTERVTLGIWLLSLLLFSLPLHAGSGWQQGFDFRNTSTFVSDPSGDTYVLPSTAYPTKSNGVTFGWVKTSLVQGRDRSTKVDPRLAGINFASNGSPATFYVDLPSSGTYNLSLAIGDAGNEQCYVQCQVQFLDGTKVLGTVTGAMIAGGYFYDATGKQWSAAAWPGSNLSQQVTLASTRLTVVVGTNKASGDYTTLAFLGVTQVSGSPNFAMSASPSSLSVQQGNQGTSTITTTISGGFNSSIALSASGMPSGTTVSFNPQTIPAPGSGSSTMTITVGSGTPVGTYPITVTGNGGGIQQNATVTLTVTAQSQPNFSISASPSSLSVQQGNQGTSTITTAISGGFNSSIALSASGMPSGTTVSFNPQTIPAPGSGGSTMTITVGGSTPTGTYPITVTGNGGGIQQNTTVTLTVTPQGGKNFSISASPSLLSIALGNLGTTTISTTVSGGFNSAIALSATGMPLGVAVAFNPQTIPAPGSGNSTMTISVLRLAPLGTYPITITGSGGGIKQTTTLTLTVAAAQDFQLSASPASITVEQGYQGNTTITSTISGGFNSAVSLSASGVPTGTTVTFNPQTIPAPGSGNSTVTIAVTLATYPGVYSLNVAGSGGGIQRYVPITLTVTPGPNFTIGGWPSALTIPQGNQGMTTVTTFVCCGFNSSIALTASGAPSGTTLNLNPSTISAPGSGNSTLTLTVGKGTATGTYPLTLTGNGGGVQQQATVTLTVTGGPPPTNANYLEPYSYSLQSGFGQPPYSYQIASGSLPSGLSMNSSGAISGTATAVGKFPFQVLVTDSSQPPQQQSSSYTLNVVIGMDEYSGLTAAPVPGCTPNGYFQLVKVQIGSDPARWVYADPNCNAFYQLAVYDASSYFILSSIMKSHYGNDSTKWAKHSLQREIAYGFNSNDIFYDDYMLPIPKGGNNNGASIQLPFLLFFATTDDAITDPSDLGIPESIKDLCSGSDNNGFGKCNYTLDIMDPNWLVANQGELALQLNPALQGFQNGFNTTPWIVAISLGDADELFMFKGNGSGQNGAGEYPHPAQVVATNAFNYNLPPINGSWQRPIVYSKVAWACNAAANDSKNFPPGQSFLEKKYGSVAALNAAWGSNYTSFCDAGGFGSGTGVIDEDGRHTAWFGNDYYNQTGMNSNLLADLNAYLYILAYQIYAPQVSVVQGYDPNHLLMCGFYGGSGAGGMRPIVAEAFHDAGCQILVMTWSSTYISQAQASNQAVYDQTGLPITVFQGSTSQRDSDMSNYPNNGAGGADYTTQLIRGQHYGTDTQGIYSEQGSNGDYYNLGVDLWSLTDNSSENRNWGFISLSDNTYDGVCATQAASIDPYGYACGGEAADYTDFTDGVTSANTTLLQQFVQQMKQ